MNQQKAKRMRRQVIGDMAERPRQYVRTAHINAKQPHIRNKPGTLRAEYQRAKRES